MPPELKQFDEALSHSGLNETTMWMSSPLRSFGRLRAAMRCKL